MKSLFIASLTVALTVASLQATAQDTLRVQTSAVCGMCKMRIEKDLAYEKGVESSDLEVSTAMLTIVYNPKKTDPDTLRERVTEIGYDADEKRREEKAFRRLPDCCQLEDIH